MVAATAPRVSIGANNSLAAAAAQPGIEWPAPVVHKVTDALEDLACSVERLDALHRSNNADLYDFIDDMEQSPLKDRLYDCWMIFQTVGEQIKDAHDVLGAITEKAYADRRAAA